MKKKIILLCIGLSIVIFNYFVLNPYLLESNTPNMEKHLKNNGYTNIRVLDTRSIYYDVLFKTDQGNFSVRPNKGYFLIRKEM